MKCLSTEALASFKRWATYAALGSGGSSIVLGLMLVLPLPKSPKQNIEPVAKIAMMVWVGSTFTAWRCGAAQRHQENTRLAEEHRELLICTHCYYHSNIERLPCAVNPHGPLQNQCSDYRNRVLEENLLGAVDAGGPSSEHL